MPETALKVRAYELGRDYPELCEWWRARGWPAVPTGTLPKTGFIAEDAEHKYAAVFLFLIEGRWAWMDYLVTNPEAPLRKRPEALELVVEAAKAAALAAKRAIGEEVLVITLLNNKNLIELCGKHGFKPGDTKMDILIWGGK